MHWLHNNRVSSLWFPCGEPGENSFGWDETASTSSKKLDFIFEPFLTFPKGKRHKSEKRYFPINMFVGAADGKNSS